MWKKFLTASLIVGSLFFAKFADAEVKLYTATGEDYAGEIESQDVAKLRARDKAIKNATKQAGIYLQTYSRTVNSELTDDEVLAITGNSYELVGEVQYNRVIKKVTDKTSIIVWQATVEVNVDDAEIKKWLRRDDKDKSALISQSREAQRFSEANDRKVESLRKRAENISNKQEKAQLKAEFEYVNKEFLSNQKVEEGNKLAYQGRFDDAIKLYGEALEINSNNAAAYNRRGSLYNSLAMLKAVADKNIPAADNLRGKAINDLNKAIQLDVNYSEAYGNRGFAYYNAKNYSAAIRDFDRAIQLNPNHVQNYIYRALYYSQIVKDNTRVLNDYNKALEIDSKSAQVYSCRATFYQLDLKDYSRAVEDYTRAIEFETHESLVALNYRSRGDCYRKLNMYDRAITDYTKFIEMTESTNAKNPLLSWTYRARGECYKALGDNSKAQADLKKFEELQKR